MTLTSTSNQSHGPTPPPPQPSPPSSNTPLTSLQSYKSGPVDLTAATVIFLLKNYANFGLAERVFYHFDLTETLRSEPGSVLEERERSNALQVSPVEIEGVVRSDGNEESLKKGPGEKDSADRIGREDTDSSTTTAVSTDIGVCGVFRLLECAPVTPWQRFSSQQKKRLRGRARNFNLRAENIHNDDGGNEETTADSQQRGGSSKTVCYQPRSLPLRLNPSTRVYFGYETTRVAFCIDASASLTSTFGSNGRGGTRHNDSELCPLDRIVTMARIFFLSLIHPISSASMDVRWQPHLSVSVLAVFPAGETSETSLLVRDFLVNDEASAGRLLEELEAWVYSEVEFGISERIHRRRPDHPWIIPAWNTSSMRHILEAGDYALSVLSSEARPFMVVATDCRSMSTDNLGDMIKGTSRVDVPVHILDISLPETHSTIDDTTTRTSTTSDNEMNFLTYDPGGPSCFPVQSTDDSAAVFSISRSTGGWFFDEQLLLEISKNIAGQQLVVDTAAQQQQQQNYQQSQTNFFRRRFVKMNGLQALTLFSLSPLSPTFNSTWGRLPPPSYLQRQFDNCAKETPTTTVLTSPLSSVVDNLDASRHFQRLPSDRWPDSGKRKQNIPFPRVTFSRYVVSPIRIKALLLTRIKEGYCVKHYGQSTQEADKVHLQFILPLEEFGIIYYELSYTALDKNNHFCGSANIKIAVEAMNERQHVFILSVKDDFIQNTAMLDGQVLTIKQQKSVELCELLRNIRRNDLLSSHLVPPSTWSDQLATSDTPFLKRLNQLTSVQRSLHFQPIDFDVVCSSEVRHGGAVNDKGIKDMIEAVSLWSDQVVADNSAKFVKATTGMLSDYVLVDIIPRVSQLFTVRMEFFSDINLLDRIKTVSSLKRSIRHTAQGDVLEKQMSPYLLGSKGKSYMKERKFENTLFHHASWNVAGLDSSEALDLNLLLTKRRVDIGDFKLLEWYSDYALFAKVEGGTENMTSSPGYLCQYELTVGEKVHIDCHMESESGAFYPFDPSTEKTSKFRRMVNNIKRRDQECGRALRSRSAILRALQNNWGEKSREDHRTNIKRMLTYSSPIHRKLRAFHSEAANRILIEMTCSLLLSGSLFGVSSARLPMSPSSEETASADSGLWFLVTYDRETMSLVQLSLNEIEEEDGRSRELTLFTSTIGDLYTKRGDLTDDLADDDSVQTHYDQECVSRFIDKFEEAYAKVFATSAFLALRECSEKGHTKMSKEDILSAIETCEFVEVSNILVVGASLLAQRSSSGESKLLQLIKTILHLVPGDLSYFFYIGTADRNLISAGDFADGVSGPKDESYPVLSGERVNPPIFVRFRLDGTIATSNDLNVISKSSVLSVEVSLFSSIPREVSHVFLPLGHQSFAEEISVRLKSFAAEQTLERLLGANMSDDNLKLVRMCLEKSTTTMILSIDVFFFSSLQDVMVPASGSSGRNVSLDVAFGVLETELMSNKGQFSLLKGCDGDFFVSKASMESDSVNFWTRISMDRNSGKILAQIYHPDGVEAEHLLSDQLDGMLQGCLHRTNQKLLLESLHQTRSASDLLILPSNSDQNMITATPCSDSDSQDIFLAGSFACPLVFRTYFTLFERTSPSQVKLDLEARVLHSFGISNHPHFFVYKDEGGEIFYLTLIDVDNRVELQVYGIHDCGPSITKQLRDLLERRIMLIGVELLSSVLTKNPHYKWRQGDLQYVSNFHSAWNNLSQDVVQQDSTTRFYEFPSSALDPVMILMLLRQNLCGSSFFHRLNDMDKEGKNPTPPIFISEALDDGGKILNMNSHEFTLYYNSAPSKLDPAFQRTSTLTPKGAEYCRQVGSGIAFVGLSLVDNNGQYIKEIPFARSPIAGHEHYCPGKDDLRMKEVRNADLLDTAGSIFLKLRILDTALNRSALFDWIHLTLNQSLIAWSSEQVLENPWKALCHKERDKRENQLDRMCPGLCTFENILITSSDLPHPAVKLIRGAAVIRSVSVARVTKDLIERCIMPPILKALSVKDEEATEWIPSVVKIMRLSRSDRPYMVSLQQKPQNFGTVSVVSLQGRKLQDSPIDCPEYVCFFSRTRSAGSEAQLYSEITVHDGISESSLSIELLQSIKKQNPRAFVRSLAFILVVKRNIQTLLLYNMKPELVETIAKNFTDAIASNQTQMTQTNNDLQARALKKLLSPTLNDAGGGVKLAPPKPPENSQESDKTNADVGTNDEEQSAPTRRIRRPTSIRRPKLIGKSVEGSAIQAVAASRNRARSTQFKNLAVASQPTRKAPQQGSDSAKSKSRVSGSTARENSLVSRPPSQAKLKELSNDEKLAGGMKLNFSSLLPVDFLLRLGSLQYQARIQIASRILPISADHRIQLPVSNAMCCLASTAWCETCGMPPLPPSILTSFVMLLGRWVASVNNNLDILSSSGDSTVFRSEVKNVNGVKCCAIVRFSLSSTREKKSIIRSKGWILNLPRRPWTRQKQKKFASEHSSLVVDRDGVAMDKLIDMSHSSLRLSSVMFDFCSSVIERTVRMLDDKVPLDELPDTLRGLMKQYPYDSQEEMGVLNYRAFTGTIVLKSYRDQMIDMFDGSKLFQRMSSESKSYDMICCGDLLCFKRNIYVKGTRTIVFLSLFPDDFTKLELLFLCRTQGQNLGDFMFREGSNVAIHILDNIAYEAGSLVRRELHQAATSLLIDDLWNSLSHNEPRGPDASKKFFQLTSLVDVESIFPHTPIGPFRTNRGLSIGGGFSYEEIADLFNGNADVDWPQIFLEMKQESIFSPHFVADDLDQENSECKSWEVFFMPVVDVFLILGIRGQPSHLTVRIASRDLQLEQRRLAGETFINFVLRFVWYTL